jgi:signal transduction histidine kinase
MSRGFPLRLALVVVVGGSVVAEGLGDTPTLWVALLDLAVGLVLVSGGLMLMLRAGQREPGLLLFAAGGLWFLANVTASPFLAFAHRGPLVQAAGDDGRRPRRKGTLALAAFGYLGAWLLAATTGSPTVALITGAGIAILALALRRAAAACLGIGQAVSAAIAGSGDARLFELATAVYAVGVLVVAIPVLTAGLRQPSAIDAVVELAKLRGVRAALAEVLHDPDLVILDTLEPDRGTVVHHHGVALGTVVHRPRLLLDERLRAAAVTAAALELEHARLAHALGERVADARASSLRLVTAGERQRQRLERRIQTGAGALLVRAHDQLGALGPSAEPLRRRLADARAELATIAAGLHPRALDADLAIAVDGLAASLPLPVDVTVEAGSVVAELAATAFFICSEALTNVVRHADATCASVVVRVDHGVLLVAVSDDGAGGARVGPSSGLQGLADRCEAVGGSFHVRSVLGGGTTVTATIPCQ